MTQPSNAAPIGQTTPSSGLFAGRGLFGGLAAGFLGAGLLGLLFGHGFLVGWLASLQSSVCYYKSFWS